MNITFNRYCCFYCETENFQWRMLCWVKSH